jgi:lipopolysaccharide transport system ATP-binding protein
MSKPAVIHVEGLGKEYRRGALQQSGLLRDHLSQAFKAPLSLLRRSKGETFWALRDVDLDVHQGEVLGLIGRNGAGKTTLLKILSRITRPTLGWAEIHGRVGSLLEVGTGFHPELTGRENMFLSGAIMGMTKREILAKSEEIVSFAELEKFIDTPVKHYSSGMYVRLAFAVAAHFEPEILLVDEVLAVGDMNFQKKCLGKMGDVAHAGRTIVLVSHQISQIRRLCHRVVWMDGGQVRQSGDTHVVVSAYESSMNERDTSEPRRGSSSTKSRFVSWGIVEPSSGNPHILTELNSTTVRFTIEVARPIRNGHHGCALFNNERQLMWAWATDLHLDEGLHDLCYTFPMLPLRPGPYAWNVTLFDDGNEIDNWECLPEMIIATEGHQHKHDRWNGVLNMPSRFQIAPRKAVHSD